METLLTPDGPLSQEKLDRAKNEPEAAKYLKAFDENYGVLYTKSLGIAQYFDPTFSLHQLTPAAIEQSYDSMLVVKQCQERLRLAEYQLLSDEFKARNGDFLHAQQAKVSELVQQAERGMTRINMAVKSMEEYRGLK